MLISHSPFPVIHLTHFHHQIDVDNLDNEETLKQVRKDRGYNYEDQVKITEAMENYEQKVRLSHY